jgi:hypothetical protein
MVVAINMLSIDSQLYLLTAGLVLGMGFASYQAFRLKLSYRSHSSLIGSLAFMALTGRQVYGLYRLRSAIAEARAKGVMIERLSWEQWVVNVGWVYLVVALFIWWLTWQRRDLKKLGA